MNDIIKIDIINGKPAVTSLQVAEHFGKEHFNVLSDIERVMLQVSENFRKLNFQGSEYAIPNPLTGGELKKPMYIMSKDGFTMLTMGYTGRKAMEFKEAYIASFNEMEEQLRSLNERPMLPKDYITALRALADAEEEKNLALEQRDYYKRTKAEIGSRREATSMATASVATRKVNALEDELGRGKRYRQVKAIPWLLDVFLESRGMYSVVGKALKRLSADLGYNVEKVETPEFPDGVNRYHVDVICAFRTELAQNPGMLDRYRKKRAA